MMSNLFSIFDPCHNIPEFIHLNWTSSLFTILIFPLSFWLMKSRFIKIFSNLLLTLHLEFKLILKNKFNFLNSIFFSSLLIFIFFNNFFGLFPYIFTSSSHLIFSLCVSLPLWIGLMLFGWINNTNHMFSHLIPQGTPPILMPFMVLIETISNVIRSGTLSIRLTANMIAGHLLLTLLSSTAISPFIAITALVIIIQMILLSLEFSVSIIQSYVFSVLSTLYTKETNYE